MTFTLWQRRIADVYGGGDYAHLTRLDQCRVAGDTLFTFLMIETDPKEECENATEAYDRIQRAIDQLSEAQNAIGDLITCVECSNCSWEGSTDELVSTDKCPTCGSVVKGENPDA